MAAREGWSNFAAAWANADWTTRVASVVPAVLGFAGLLTITFGQTIAGFVLVGVAIAIGLVSGQVVRRRQHRQ